MYNYRKGDKVFFKVVVGIDKVPLEHEEVIKLTNALNTGRGGLMVFKMGIVRLDKVNGIVPDYERMQDWNVGGMKIELPDVGKLIMQETPQELDRPREGRVTSITDALKNIL